LTACLVNHARSEQGKQLFQDGDGVICLDPLVKPGASLAGKDSI
jgi:hypothetical protein